MKKIISSIAILTVMVSCKQETKYVNHDSPLMQKMHSMSQDMDAMTMSMDPDHDFAMMMKMHHQGAIDLAIYQLANGNDNTIKAKAQMMKDAQIMEIMQLDSFMNAHTAIPDNVAGMAFMDASERAMNEMDSDADAQKLNGDSDHDFVHLMIQHHKSAIKMADAEIQHGKIQEIKDMATMMKTDQTNEIAQLQSWLNSND
jgi:uncharacterized protein (DUF305 family)